MVSTLPTPLARPLHAGAVVAARQLLPTTSGCAPDRDVTHVALASAYEMDILLSWNCRHIANAAIQTRLRRLVEAAGFTLPVICTPEELMESDHEQND